MGRKRTVSGSFRVGTRGSLLAMAQARWVKERLSRQHPEVEIDIQQIRTHGDRDQTSPLHEVGGQGLFVKELEVALMERQIDLAVHSAKDMPSRLPLGTRLGAVPEREDVRDVLISRGDRTLEELPEGARIGTSSLRRTAQLRHLRPDLEIVPIRGNVDTRVRKLEAGEVEAVILAAAGLARLGRLQLVSQYLDPEKFLPAPGQGALGVEIRADDRDALDLLRRLDDQVIHGALDAERAFLAQLAAGCQVPVAAWAREEKGRIVLDGLVSDVEGRQVLRGRMAGPLEDAWALGTALANELLQQGAAEILEETMARERGEG